MSIFDLKNKSFSPDMFKKPTEEFYPVYGWFWNGPITDEKTEAQILEMKRLGIHAFCIICEPRDFRPTGIPTLTDPNYLTDAYFERYKFAIKKASELGMKCWLYDEGGWPSGGACGLVMLDHPEYARRSLDKRTVTLKKGVPYKKGEDVFAAFICGDKMVSDSEKFDKDTELDEYYSRVIAFETPAKPEVPDLTLADSTDYFIKITHERYKDFIKEYFGNTITAVFTDEPMAPPIPFRDGLVEEYEKKYGESVLPHLPAIYGAVPAKADAAIAKMRWFDLASKAFCDNFLSKCRKWANENGLAFTGHVDNDDEPKGAMYGKNFHVLRALRCMDVPGIDVIWRQIFPNINGKNYENRFFPRYASSAAAQNGTKLAMTESFGVYGNGLTFEHMRFIVGFQAIRGVTLFNPMKISYERRGLWLAGELPSFEEDYACYAHLKHFNEYMERLSYVSTCGDRYAKTALYYPINNIWAGIKADTVSDEFDALGFKMESRGVDFDIVDDDVILGSKTTSDGIISMGLARYTEIVIPKSTILTDEIKRKLNEFEAGGGKVLYTAEEATKSVELVSDGDEYIASKRITEDGEIISLFNQSIEKKSATVKIDGSRAYFIDITNGKIFDQPIDNGAISVSLESGETCAILVTKKQLSTEAFKNYDSEIILSDFKLRRKTSFTYGHMFPESKEIVEESTAVELGCWSDAAGPEFSGTCVYSTCFKGVSTDAVLDLGDVRHTCEVILNGKSLGVKIMKPYRFNINKELLQDENELEILVTNTVGNQQHYTKTFDKWAPWQLTAYVTKQDVFDEDTLDSGLYGPVKIYTAK